MPVQHFLDDIRKQAGDDDDEDGEPGRATGQQLNKDKIHVLRVEKWPIKKEKNYIIFFLVLKITHTCNNNNS